MPRPHINRSFSIAVCGSNADGAPKDINKKAKLVGKTIADLGHTLFTGVTTGFSLQAVKGAYEVGGRIVGISPAESEQERKDHYEQVDKKMWSPIIYTGVGYKMRDIIMIRSVQAAIYIGGGVGTLVEMASAPDSHVVMGVLEGSGGATELIDTIRDISHRNKPVVVKDSDPVRLVKKVVQKIKERERLP